MLLCARLLLVALALASTSLASQRQRLSAPLGPDGDVQRFEVSADGRYAVYLSSEVPGGRANLYSVLLPDGSPKRLESKHCQSDFELTGNGRFVVYTRFTSFTTRETCSVRIEGNRPPTVLGPFTRFRISPDSQKVVFVNETGLHWVPTTGITTPVRLASGTTIHHHFEITPDSLRVLFVTEGSIRHEGGMGHLFGARLDFSLSLPVGLNTDESGATVGQFLASPNGKWIVFRLGRLGQPSVGLASVPARGGSEPVLLNPAPPSGSFDTFTLFSSPRFTPDGIRVVYSVDQDVLGRDQLYSAPIHGGGAPLELNAPLASAPGVLFHRVTQDGARVVYLASQDSAALELFVVPIGGGEARKLNPPGEQVSPFALSPDGRHVAYPADPEGDGTRQLFLAALEPGPDVLPLSDPALTAHIVSALPGWLEFTPDGSRVLFLSQEPASANFALRLHAARTDGSTPPERLDGPSQPAASLALQTDARQDNYYFRLAAEHRWAVYVADLEHDEVFELWASPIAKRTTARR